MRVARAWRYPVKSLLGQSAEFADERRFRPNLVLDYPGDEPVEQDWIGRTLCIGDEVVLRIVAPTERCGMIALEQDGVPREPRVLRHITRNAGLMFGVHADIVSPGRIRVGDTIMLEVADRSATGPSRAQVRFCEANAHG